jgi:hypothetical protein
MKNNRDKANEEPKVCNECGQFNCICNLIDDAIEIIKHKPFRKKSNEKTINEFVRPDRKTN